MKMKMVESDKWATEKQDRKRRWKQFQEDNKEVLMNFAHTNGFDNGEEPFILAEAFSRTLIEKATRQVYGEKGKQQHLRCHYDTEVADKKIEGKFRLNDSDQYPTDDISLSKEEYLEMEDSCIIVFAHWDGVVRAYDLKGKHKEDEWHKPRYTTKDSEKVTETRLQYDPKDAIWTTTITLPPEL